MESRMTDAQGPYVDVVTLGEKNYRQQKTSLKKNK